MRMVITLSEPERQALTRIARMEVRDPRDQLRYWLRRDAQARGLLPDPEQPVAAVAGQEVDCEPAR
jgi:hypothetical protein